ncbi:MAG: 2-C-methyl-D-erythritol 4-phosphate cytidylyltransferase [Bacteroidales bacterium]|nr:2-C-methyl-D-erythritol 4-phosphate cytidylyltransferase [Bacteroidales bacterium]
MTRKKFLIIMAAGKGSRMGSELPKQFLRIGDRAILQITMEKFLEAVPGIRVITVLSKSWTGWWRRYCIESNFVCPQTFVSGGITRFHSVANALNKVPDGAVVAVHDGVRPLISVECIRRLFAEAETSPAVIPVVPIVDTIKPLRLVTQPHNVPAQLFSEDISLSESSYNTLELIPGVNVDRSILYAAQTPQIFHSELLRDAYRQPYDTRFTDDASVLENKNIPLTYVEGERYNIKITTQEDLAAAEALLRTT